MSRHQVEPGVVTGEWWHRLQDDRVQCDLCPRGCRLRDGQRGFCGIRQARSGEIRLTAYGRISGLSVDPIEKKPLNHFLPGSRVLSFGTPGCSLGCRYCQNWELSRAKIQPPPFVFTSPEDVSEAAHRRGCKSIAFTYNEPSIFAEYAIDCARAAHANGLKTVAVTAGYMNPQAREAFFRHIDAANVDLKAFQPDFYRKMCLAELGPVLDTLVWLRHASNVWLEVTTLLIPGHNDSLEEIEALCAWFVRNLGEDVPLHFTAFHPAYRLLDAEPTGLRTLRRARKQAKAAGIRHVYTGNIHDIRGQSTYCHGCGVPVIQRQGYHILRLHLQHGSDCPSCGEKLAGVFERDTATVSGML